MGGLHVNSQSSEHQRVPAWDDRLHLTGYDFFISVDVETAGSEPESYSLLSIGACVAFCPEQTFYVELQPASLAARPEALAVSGLSMERLAIDGLPPKLAMERFAEWIRSVTPVDCRPVFVAFNAPFDWMFVNVYFHRYLGENPFGHSALDLKALYMGLTGAPWSETSMPYVASRYSGGRQLTHNALADARDQAELLRGMLEEARAHGWSWLS